MKVKIFILSFLAAILLFACSKKNFPATTRKSQTFTNPLLSSGPDPWVLRQGGYYYFMATTARNLVIRKTKKIADLANAEKAVVWTPPPGTNYSTDIWAPELHFINGKWYIYFSADSANKNFTHRIYVLENATSDPMKAQNWTFIGKLAEASDRWAIDGTVFTYKNRLYAVWSGWQGSKDGEQDLFIAQLANPYTFATPRVMIAHPQYDWEKLSANVPVLVNEGPEALINPKGNLFITYSANGCWTDDYSLGLLSLRPDGDPLNPEDWLKHPQPVFTKNTTGGAFGPGHNGFFKSPDGKEDWIIYHANNLTGQGCGGQRNPRIQKFSWNADGTPNFGMPASINEPITKPSGE